MSTRWEAERALLASDVGCTPKLVMLVLLTYADAKSAVVPAEHTPSLSDLARGSGLARSSVARELVRLEKDGWVIRKRPPVHLARTRHARTRYRITIPASPTQGLDLVPQGDQASPTQGPGWSHSDTRLVPQGDQASPTVGHSPDLKPLKPQQRAQPRGIQTVAATLDCTTPEAESVLNLIEAEKKPRNLIGLVNKIARDGELGDWLERVRANGHRHDRAAAVEAAKDGPECEHRIPGGNDPHYPQCATCRHRRSSGSP